MTCCAALRQATYRKLICCRLVTTTASCIHGKPAHGEWQSLFLVVHHAPLGIMLAWTDQAAADTAVQSVSQYPELQELSSRVPWKRKGSTLIEDHRIRFRQSAEVKRRRNACSSGAHCSLAQSAIHAPSF